MQKWFRLLGRLEGLSFLFLLCVAMPLKYWAALPIAVRIMGPVHGFLFLAYCAYASYYALEHQWSFKKHALAYVSAVLPFGTFYFEKVYLPNLKKA